MFTRVPNVVRAKRALSPAAEIRMATQVVTVFGGSGFIGRNVVERLVKKDWMIRIAVRNLPRARVLMRSADGGKVTIFPAPVQDEKSVRSAVEGANAVVNIVGILYEKGAQTFQAIHHLGAARVAAVAAATGVQRLVHISAIGARAEAGAGYARSKGAGEEAVRKTFPKATVLRPSIVFGPGDSFLNLFARMARLSPALPLIGGGRTRFQPVYVGDVADAIIRCLEDPACQGKTYELGGPRVYTFRQLIEIVLRQTRRPRLLISIPFGLAELQAAFLELLPVPPLTRDQVRLLRQDNVVGENALTLEKLRITPKALEDIIPAYLG